MTETESLLSGARVLTMAQVGAGALFQAGVTLTLSDAALDALSLHADSVFYIELFPTEDGFFPHCGGGRAGNIRFFRTVR